jgi:hypothetical protein
LNIVSSMTRAAPFLVAYTVDSGVANETKEMNSPQTRDGGREQALKLAEEEVIETRKSKGAGGRRHLRRREGWRKPSTQPAIRMKPFAYRHQSSMMLRKRLVVPRNRSLRRSRFGWGKDGDYLNTCRRAVEYAESATRDTMRAQRVAAKIACLHAILRCETRPSPWRAERQRCLTHLAVVSVRVGNGRNSAAAMKLRRNRRWSRREQAGATEPGVHFAVPY